jgi:hypothetical protein
MKPAKLSDLTPDPRNANRGTERGRNLLKRSLQDLKAGRSILVDRNGTVIAGNKTREAAIAIGMKDAIVVETDGSQLVVVKRTDLDLSTDTAALRLRSLMPPARWASTLRSFAPSAKRLMPGH